MFLGESKNEFLISDHMDSSLPEKRKIRKRILVDIHKVKPLVNYQNQRLDGHYQGINTQPACNDLENQVRYDPITGEVLEIYDQPTGKTDSISMQHDIDYSVCKDDRK